MMHLYTSDLVLICSFVILTLSACTKEDDMVPVEEIVDYSTDYRYDYQGVFHFVKSSYFWWGGNTPGLTRDDTITFDGIVKIQDNTDSNLIIFYGTDQNFGCFEASNAGAFITPRLSIDGKLVYKKCSYTSIQNRFAGSFSGSDSLEYGYSMGGNGGGTVYHIEGARIK